MGWEVDLVREEQCGAVCGRECLGLFGVTVGVLVGLMYYDLLNVVVR